MSPTVAGHAKARASGPVAGGATGASASPWRLAGATLALFLVWSHTFLAFEALLDPVQGRAPYGAAGLLVARYVPVAALCALWCFGARRAASLAIVRRHWRRLLLCGALCVEGYNGFLYWGMQHSVAGPVASVLTTLSPLYLQALGVVFLGERLTRPRATGLVLGLGGVVLIATAKGGTGSSAAAVAVASLAPLCWSVFTALSKPVLREASPVLWTYLVLAAGGAPLALVAPWVGGPETLSLSASEAWLLAFLVVPATVAGFAVWNGLLRHLPASTVGLTVFLNPPLTTASKAFLSAAFPSSFAFLVTGQEWVGGAAALAGVAVAVAPWGALRARLARRAPS